MNLLYVSSDASEEAALRRELEPFSPAPAIHLSPGIEEARTRMAVAGAFDALLIDGSVPRPEAAFMAEGLKRERNPAVIVVLTPETGDEAAEALLGGCVDLFVPKRPGFGAVLHQALLQAAARRPPAPHQARRVRILYAGELEPFRRHFADMPSLLIHPLPRATDGSPQTGDAAGDLVVIDCPGESAAAVKAITDTVRDYPRIPVIALTEPGDEAAAIAALNAGAADSIPRTEQFPRRLLAAVERAVRMGRLAREKEALKKQGERLRLIVETVPVGVALVAPDGSFLAVNRTGLERIGAHRSDQVIGKNLLHLVPPQEREAVQKFLATVGAWSSASISLKWKGIDGSIPGVELRAIPLRRNPGSAASVLATLHPPRSLDGDAGAEGVILRKYEDLTTMLRTYEVRFRELQEKSSFKFSRWETALRLAESQKKASEEEQARLQAAVEEAEARVRRLEEEHDAQRERWEQSQRELKERSERLEAAAAELKASRAQVSDSQGDGQGRLEEERRDFEERQAQADAALAEVSDLLEKEKAQHRLQREEMERRLREAERHQSELEAALEETGARLQSQDEALRAELAARDEGRTELERRLEETRAELAARDEGRTELERRLEETQAERATLEESLRAELAERDESRAEIEHQLEETLAARATLEESLRAELAARDESRDDLRRKLEETLAARATLEESLRAELAARDESRDDLRSRLEETEARLRRQEEEYRTELAAREESRAGLQRKLEETENSWLALEAALEETEERLAGLTAAHGQLEERHRGADGMRASLESALRMQAARYAALCERSGADRAWQELAAMDLERKHLAAEEQRAPLEAALRDAEARIRELTEKYIAERREQERREEELHRHHQAAETRVGDLEAALAEAESRARELASAREGERSEMQQSLLALEARYAEAESLLEARQRELGEAAARLAALGEQHASERARLTAELAELDQKYQAADKQRISLQTALADSESRGAAMKERHDAEQERWGIERGDLELRIREGEKQLAGLQTALAGAQSALSQLAEKHRTEISQYEFAQKKAEQKFQTAEKQRGTLAESLQEVETRLADLTGRYQAEQVAWQSARAEMERRLEEAEKAHAAAVQNTVREAEARLAWISEQNQSKAVQLEQAQKQLEELQSENRTLAREGSHYRRGYQRLSRFTSAGIVRATREGQVVECNDIAARMFGYPNAQAALSRPDGSPFRIYAFEGALAARLDEEGSLEGIEWTALGKEGKPVRVRENAALVEAADGETPLVERILTDISDAHGLGEEIRRIQSAGDLAAATVTSFRELCASLAEAGERLLQAAGDAEEVRRLADSLARDAGRGIRHAGQFLSLAQRDDRSPDLLDFNEILTGNDRLLHSLIGTDIELEMDLAPRLGLVWADRNEVTQLIGNLMANAREALPLGGLVTIETRDIEVAGPDPEIPPELRPGIYVRLVFSTDGCAVQPERRHSSIRAIAGRMGGCLRSTNDPRTGNIHTVYIPRVEGASAGAGREAGSVGA
jgi:PAS domain S-box-containing protein